MISLDFIGPMRSSSSWHVYCVVVTHYSSEYVLLFPLTTATSLAVVECVEKGVFLVYGYPEYFVCDNGTPIRSKLF